LLRLPQPRLRPRAIDESVDGLRQVG